MSEKLSEETLLAGIKNCSDDVIRYLYSNNFPKAKKLVDEESIKGMDTKDLFHEALIVLIENVRHGKFNGASTVETYLMSILKFKFYDQIRKTNKIKSYEMTESYEQTVILSEEHEQSAEIKNLAKGLKKLTEECERILTSYYYENLSLKEIATQMSYTDAFVRVKKSRCIKKLRESITKSI